MEPPGVSLYLPIIQVIVTLDRREEHGVEGQVEEHQDVEHQTGIPVRLGCGILILATMLCSVLVVAVIDLVATGEIDLRGEDLEGYRLWMVWGDGITTIGLSSSREDVNHSENDMKCLVTTVRFFILGGDAEDAQGEFCECYHALHDTLTYSGACAVE